jgi:hypothetical protein
MSLDELQTMARDGVCLNHIPDRLVQDTHVPDTPSEVCDILMLIGVS